MIFGKIVDAIRSFGDVHNFRALLFLLGSLLDLKGNKFQVSIEKTVLFASIRGLDQIIYVVFNIDVLNIKVFCNSFRFFALIVGFKSSWTSNLWTDFLWRNLFLWVFWLFFFRGSGFRDRFVVLHFFFKSRAELGGFLFWLDDGIGRQFVFVPDLKLFNKVLYSFEMFDRFPGALAGRVSLPLDLIFYKLGIPDAFANDPLHLI